MISSLIMLICLGSTLYMTGLIWFVQCVHYPLFNQVGHDHFPKYHAAHVRYTGPVVILAMFGELLSAGGLLLIRPQNVSHGLAIVGFILAVITWLSTFLLQVPQHQRLTAGFDAATHTRLVRTNWIRTITWSSHSLIVLAMTVQAIGD